MGVVAGLLAVRPAAALLTRVDRSTLLGLSPLLLMALAVEGVLDLHGERSEGRAGVAGEPSRRALGAARLGSALLGQARRSLALPLRPLGETGERRP